MYTVVVADDMGQVGGVLCRCTARVAIPEHKHSDRNGSVCLGWHFASIKPEA